MTMKVSTFPLIKDGARLYILVRTDISQMNAGKLGAQAAHAASKFVIDVVKNNEPFSDLYEEMTAWEQQAGGFGTKITLAATEEEIKSTVDFLRNQFSLEANTVVDPTYPMVNVFGELFTRSELTCGYVFAPRDITAEAMAVLRKFKLHP